MMRWETIGKALMWCLFAIFMYLGVCRIGGALRATDEFSVIFEVIIATVYFLLGALSVCGIIAERIGMRFGRLIYPFAQMKAPAKRLAAAESLFVKKDFAAAQSALEQIIREEPCNLAAGILLSRVLIEWKGSDGRTEACAILISQLRRIDKALPGSSDAVLLLADLLEESGLTKRALETVAAELGKGYCRAEAALLKRRFDSLEAAVKAS